MKKIFAIAFLNLVTATAAAQYSPVEYFYKCSGLGQVDENIVGINLKTNKAGFFDDEVTSYMKLVDTRYADSSPPQTIMIYKGKNASTKTGTLTLYFNLTKKTVHLDSTDQKGLTTEVGTASCENAIPWDDLN
ncbi:MAG: hypothetical protein AABY53_03750 [Bdellovibrionota bacterium]